jgi:hypothetical protein
MSGTHTATIKIAPVASAERLSDPAWQRPGRVLFWRGALQLLPGRLPIPVVIDHDTSRQVGHVDSLFEMDWIDGAWICARATLDNAPGWLKPFTTRASFGRFDVSESEPVTRAFVKEVTLCCESEPLEPRAELVSLKRTKAMPAAGGVIDTEPAVIRRYSGRVLGVR